MHSSLPTVPVSTSAADHQLVLWIKAQVDIGLTKLAIGSPNEAVDCFKQALGKASTKFSAYDALVHNLLIAYKQSIDNSLRTNDFSAVNHYLNEAFALQLKGTGAEDTGFRGRFADSYYDLGKVLSRARQHAAALACVRRAIAIQPCPSYYVDLTNALGFVREQARLEDYTRNYGPSQLGRHLFIACAPKSGSTFLKNVLVRLTQFKDLFCTYAALQNEQELDLPQLAKFGMCNTVTQQHCRATEANIHLMQAFGIRPIILVRNIYDTVASLRDFYADGFTFSTFFDHEDFSRLPPDEQVNLLIDHVVPWYFQFVASWQRAERDGRLSLRWLTYEAMTADKTACIGDVLEFYGISAKPADIETVVTTCESDPRANRFNKGIAGRGQTIITDNQRQRIQGFARYFPQSDFSCLGLE